MSLEKFWDIEGTVILNDGTKINVKSEYTDKYGMYVSDVQDQLREKLIEMINKLPEENFIFSVKKRKVDADSDPEK
jgi:hypothetical protein